MWFDIYEAFEDYANIIKFGVLVLKILWSLLVMHLKISFIILSTIHWISETCASPEVKLYYFELEKKLSWQSAKTQCENRGMKLLTIANNEEFNMLKDYTNNKYGNWENYILNISNILWHKHIFWGGNKRFWMGPMNVLYQCPGFAYNENIKRGPCKGNYRLIAGKPVCVQMKRESDLYWNDGFCNEASHFICDLQLKVIHK